MSNAYGSMAFDAEDTLDALQDETHDMEYRQFRGSSYYNSNPILDEGKSYCLFFRNRTNRRKSLASKKSFGDEQDGLIFTNENERVKKSKSTYPDDRFIRRLSKQKTTRKMSSMSYRRRSYGSISPDKIAEKK